ncbi:MAG: response regulator transcription factor, partial [Planctomycetota bacterium]
EKKYDAVVLDIMLPGTDGFGVLESMRRSGNSTPVIMLTARDALGDRIRGLDSGADDYIVKPFSFAELLARIRAVIRRTGDVSAEVLEYGGVRMDLVKRKVSREEKNMELTAREFDLLEYFLRNQEQVLTRGMILQGVWGYQFDGMSNVVDVYVNYLRNKIDADWDEKLLHTVRGVGYVMRRESEE